MIWCLEDGIIAENVTVGENAVVGAMPTEDEKGVATIGAGVNVGANAKIGQRPCENERDVQGPKK